MSEDDGLSCVVDSVYDAALNPMLWSEALARMAAFIGGQPGALAATDLIGKFVKAGHHVGPDLQYMQMQAEAYGEFDPLTTMRLVEIGQFEGLPGLHDECRNKGTFRPEWAPQGDVAGAGLETSQGCEFLGGLRNEARDKANFTIDDDMRRRCSGCPDTAAAAASQCRPSRTRIRSSIDHSGRRPASRRHRDTT